ncbi:MAG: M28 family peptidase, partial [Turicibacter sp.]
MTRFDKNDVFRQFHNAIDLNHSKQVMETLAHFGDDAATGNRAAGSQASANAASYLHQLFNEIGLTNVHADHYPTDGWNFSGAKLLYKDKMGTLQNITLGGYATTIQANDERISVVDGGKGRLADYKYLGDVRGKLILISIKPHEDFWINYPAYQAHLKGAKAVLVASEYSHPRQNILISQDPIGPSDAPILAISLHDAKVLKELIEKSVSKEIQVKLTANSEVVKQALSCNIWGDIKGKSDEVIYLMAHYDGYYHSVFDDASGVSTITGIAKAIINSGYTPERTLRIITHGAEEWGRENSDYDWAVGAYMQITHLHPEWAKHAFAIINIDGNFAVQGQRAFEIKTSPEIKNFVSSSVQPFMKDSGYFYDIFSPTATAAEDFSYLKAGIP